MSPRCRCVALLFVVAVTLLVAVPITVAADTTDAVDSAAKPRNIIQACRGELEDVCDVRQVERVDCLLKHYQDVTASVCKEWLSARSVCMAFVEKRAKVEPRCQVRDYRRCIRKTPKDLLPVACRSSDYYESLFIHKPRKFVVDNDDL